MTRESRQDRVKEVHHRRVAVDVRVLRAPKGDIRNVEQVVVVRVPREDRDGVVRFRRQQGFEKRRVGADRVIESHLADGRVGEVRPEQDGLPIDGHEIPAGAEVLNHRFPTGRDAGRRTPIERELEVAAADRREREKGQENRSTFHFFPPVFSNGCPPSDPRLPSRTCSVSRNSTPCVR